jgi:hypothetical protein
MVTPAAGALLAAFAGNEAPTTSAAASTVRSIRGFVAVVIYVLLVNKGQAKSEKEPILMLLWSM